MKSLLIVESQNDKAFIEALLEHLQLAQIETDYIEKVAFDTLESFKGEDEKIYNGLSLTSLTQKLEVIKHRLLDTYSTLENIGIIIDADDMGIDSRLQLCNDALEKAFGAKKLLSATDELTSYTFTYQKTELSIAFAFYCMNVKGRGELSSLLKEIKKEASPYADCLVEKWKPCYESKEIAENKQINPNQFDKLWLEIYIKYDQTKRTKRNKDSANLSLILAGRDKKGYQIFDFNHTSLTSLSAFLKLFSS